jgi:membrane protein YqaA with SNARE-associated domain
METLRDSLLALGLPGLFLVALLDSLVPLPGGVDAIVMLLAWKRPELCVVVALVAALGSSLGGWILFRIAHQGGSIALRRFDARKHRWVSERVRRNGALAIVVAVLAPPPLPTKVFIIVAGLVGMDWRRFVAAVFLGRLARYLGEAYLAVRVGDRAAEVLRANSHVVALALGLLVLGVLLGRRLLRPRD